MEARTETQHRACGIWTNVVYTPTGALAPAGIILSNWSVGKIVSGQFPYYTQQPEY